MSDRRCGFQKDHHPRVVKRRWRLAREDGMESLIQICKDLQELKFLYQQEIAGVERMF